MTRRTPILIAGALAAGTLLLSGCATADDRGDGSRAEGGTAEHTDGPRLAVTYDGGVLVLDEDLAVQADEAIDGFTRVNAAGDGRHVLVTVPEGFRVLDTAAAQGATPDAADGDSSGAVLTDAVFPADAGGHVVVHGERTALFADGTGDVTLFDHEDLDGASLPETERVTSEEAHHGVAIELEDGTLLTTIGTEESRSGVRALDASGEETARSEECPDVHGEGAVRGEVAVFGCTDGALVYDDGRFTKLDAPAEYGRTGNLFTTETSSIAVGDHNDDPDSEGYLLDQVALIDTAADAYRVVDGPEDVRFTFRGIARGPEDEAVLLGDDGALHLLDPETGEWGSSIPVVDPWEGPAEWQDPHPAVRVAGDVAFVTDPAERRVHAVDLTSGEVIASSDRLPGVPNEIAVA